MFSDKTLDLSRLDPEEYYGSIVHWQGRRYRVGRHIATGFECIVHRLIDAETGEYSLVIKIERNPNQKYSFEQEDDGLFHLHTKHLLTFALLALDGGTVQIQPRVRIPDYHCPKEKTDKLESANKKIENDEPDNALSIYQKLISEYPDDPDLYYNASAVLYQLNRREDAYLGFCRAIELDLLDIAPRLAAIKTAASISPMDAFLKQLRDATMLFSRNNEVRNLGIEILLNKGYPDLAVDLLDGGQETFEKHYGTIIDEFDKKQQSRRMLNELNRFDNPQEFTPTPSLESLQSIVDTYSKDYAVTLNYAFALRRDGQYGQAITLMNQILLRVQYQATHIVLVNIAFCYLLDGKYEEAHSWFKYILERFTEKDDNNQIIRLPCMTNYVIYAKNEYMYIEERHENILPLLEQVFRSTHHETFRDLTKMYTAEKE